ncbi:hypothetical protein C4571_02200 [Candidatus Parcubacteria bacterium]|nr:MAG: hypothetical protein C4571_02200 [Candidatus Parcubacteria bacterium]
MPVSGEPPYSWYKGTSLTKQFFWSRIFCEAMQALNNRAAIVEMSPFTWYAYRPNGSVIGALEHLSFTYEEAENEEDISAGKTLENDTTAASAEIYSINTTTKRIIIIATSTIDWNAGDAISCDTFAAVISDTYISCPDDDALKNFKAWRHSNVIYDMRTAIDQLIASGRYKTPDTYEDYTLARLLTDAVAREDWKHTIAAIQGLGYYDPEDIEEILKCADLLIPGIWYIPKTYIGETVVQEAAATRTNYSEAPYREDGFWTLSCTGAAGKKGSVACDGYHFTLQTGEWETGGALTAEVAVGETDRMVDFSPTVSFLTVLGDYWEFTFSGDASTVLMTATSGTRYKYTPSLDSIEYQLLIDGQWQTWWEGEGDTIRHTFEAP